MVYSSACQPFAWVSKIAPPLIALVGPTATGKTALSIALSQALNGEVINADSMQFYPGLDIGTAKVSVAEQQGIQHHLIDVLSLDQEASVSEFQKQSRRIIHEVRDRGKTPVLTGGSGLYVRACLDVLEFPPTDMETRKKLLTIAELNGPDEIRRRLHAVDPESADKIHDTRRLVRALEVYEISGRTFTSYMPQRQHEESMEPVVQIGLRIDREILHGRIAQRVQEMIDQGWINEVQHLLNQGLRQAPTASKAIGYSQLISYLDGESSLDEAIEKIIVATRRFAKRQETWFKADPRVQWIDALAPDVNDQALEIISAASN